MGAVSSTLHLKVNYPSGEQVEELVGSQSMARQCLMAIIRHQLEVSPRHALWRVYSNQGC